MVHIWFVSILVNGVCACVCGQSCIRPAKTLSYMINSRHIAVISDVELSVLKVSLLERVQFHPPPARRPSSSLAASASRERKGASSASVDRGAAGGGRHELGTTAVVATAMSAALAVFQHNFL